MTGCGGQELLFLDITFPTLTLRVPPPPSSLGTLLFHWPFGGSAHDCTLPFLEGVEFQGFLVRILTKPYPAIPHIPPCLYCSVDFRLSGIRPWRSPWREGWGFTVRTMGYHWTYATRRLSSSFFIGISFSSISQNMQASPCAVHKNRHPASVIPFMSQSFLPSTKAYSIYCYSFQFPQTPIACHLNGLPDKR